ncbi:sulfatase [Pontibacter sp. G13]|uniref:sulfatase family protein n=1 Tax=Pontibacter sp. G13 TaxID=3074898 RepID=UPI00288B2F65|nr:sulfatase [Pontibacter sp. G13]WNJ18910.1 sulfatase [Pontibacter sp. G13]
MNRFNLYIFGLLPICYLLQSCSFPSDPQESQVARKPNLIHIFADDLGYGDLGCFGASDIRTPNLDAMATAGMKFTDFYSAAHICSPSRYALMTGRYPQRIGLAGVFFPESFTGIPAEEYTMAEMLQSAGYATGIVGKWHLGHQHAFLPLQNGFDEYFGIPYSNDMESVVYLSGNEPVDFHVDQHYLTQAYTQKALDFIDRHAEAPFFLYFAHNMPHVPLYASPEFEGRSERGLYGDVVEELDWSVGEILAKLESLGLLENTLVVFSSDNGPWLVMKEHGGSAGELREGKQYTFDGGMKVPTIAMWQGTIEANSTHSGIATQMDWFPTMAQLAGLELPDSIAVDGRDLTNVLKGTGDRAEDEMLFFDGMKVEGFRKGDWKVKMPYKGFSGAKWKEPVASHDTLLVNVSTDPGETQNLLSEHREKALELIEQMNQAVENLGALPKPMTIRTKADNSHYEFLERRIQTP